MARKSWALACLLWLLPTTGPAFTEEEQRMIDWIDAHQEDAIGLLAETVEISSGTMNHAGVREVGRVLARELESLGLVTEWVELPPELQRAGHLFARQLDGPGPKILLIGHLDTVFEADDAFQGFTREGDLGRGPGIEDMKAGNVAIVYALKALAEIGALGNIPVVAAFTGDEEMPGDPLSVSRKDLVQAGQWADIALGFEAAIEADGADWVTVSRRSSSEWLLTVEGRQAHSGRIFSDRVGAGAIFEASRILNGFYQEVRGEPYLTFNAGTILGGTDVEYDLNLNRGTAFGKTNVVPRKAVVHGGIRTISQEQLDRAQAAMQRIVDEHLPQTDARIEFFEGYPPMAPTEGNRALAKVLSGINEELGRGPMQELDPSRRGAADVSFVAPYTDALAGMGGLGEGGHTPDENLELSSLALAAKRAALLILRLSRQAAD